MGVRYSNSDFKAASAQATIKREKPLRRGQRSPTVKLKPKPCPYCKDKYTPTVFNQPCCRKPDCVVAFYNKQKKNKIKQEEKGWKVRKAVLKEKTKTLSQHESEAKKAFQKWVRHRDRDFPCISCFKFNCPDWAGGHYLDAGVYSGLIFHPDNCHKQCNSHCNGFLGGNKVNYRIGLINRIGEERVKWLEENKDRLKSYKYTKDELTDIKNKYLQLLKEK